MLATEQRNPATKDFDKAGTDEMLRLMDEANRRSVDAVREALQVLPGKVVPFQFTDKGAVAWKL